MQIHILRLLTLFLVVSLSSCTKTTVEIKDYVCPKLPSSGIALYEFNNSNEAIYTMKYLLIERDSIEENVFLYAILNKEFDLLNAFKERREKDKTVFTKFIIPESNIEQTEVHFHHIDITNCSIDYSFDIGESYQHEIIWNSYYAEGGKYTSESTRKLQGNTSSVQHEDEEVPVIIFTGKDGWEIVSPENPIVQTVDSRAVVKYGLDIGIMYLKMSFSNGVEAVLTLENIYYGEDVEKIMKGEELELKI